MPPTSKPKPTNRVKGSLAFLAIQKEVEEALDAGMYNRDIYEQVKDRFPASLSQFNKYVSVIRPRQILSPPKNKSKGQAAAPNPPATTAPLAPATASAPEPTIAPAPVVPPVAPSSSRSSPQPDPLAKPRRFQNQSRSTEDLF